MRHPKDMGQSEIEAYLNHMTDKRKVSANTQSVALNAIAFLYCEVLKIVMPCLEKLRQIKRYKPIPVVVSQRETAGPPTGWASVRYWETILSFRFGHKAV